MIFLELSWFCRVFDIFYYFAEDQGHELPGVCSVFHRTKALFVPT